MHITYVNIDTGKTILEREEPEPPHLNTTVTLHGMRCHVRTVTYGYNEAMVLVAV